MRVLMINIVCGIRSTGRICTDLATALEKQGHEVKIAYGREKVPEQFQKYAIRIGSDIDVKIHGIKARLMDDAGFGSKTATERFIEWIKEYNPDVIHLHNIHGYYINIEILFAYLKKCGKKIIWTLHDCWSFTGHCSYFDYAACNKWMTGCEKCIQKKEYPKSILFDNSKRNYLRKKELFCGLPNLILVTPSYWLANLVKQSFLKENEVLTIHNGVDINVFKPIKNNSIYSLKCENKKIVLGVAAIWNRRKGLEDFIKLANILDDSHRILLVGLTQKQMKLLPNNIFGIERTNNVQELANLYSTASVFVNPTYEDNYPTTNLEAIACKTPVISYNTGGSVESARLYGDIVEKGNIYALKNSIYGIEEIEYDNTIRLSLSTEKMLEKYLNLYSRL